MVRCLPEMGSFCLLALSRKFKRLFGGLIITENRILCVARRQMHGFVITTGFCGVKSV